MLSDTSGDRRFLANAITESTKEDGNLRGEGEGERGSTFMFNACRTQTDAHHASQQQCRAGRSDMPGFQTESRVQFWLL